MIDHNNDLFVPAFIPVAMAPSLQILHIKSETFVRLDTWTAVAEKCPQLHTLAIHCRYVNDLCPLVTELDLQDCCDGKVAAPQIFLWSPQI